MRAVPAKDLLLLSGGLARLRAAGDLEIAAAVGRPSGLAAGGPGGCGRAWLGCCESADVRIRSLSGSF